MRYMKQLSIILFISLLGEVIHAFLPLPVPASIYGLVILLIGLSTKLIPLAAVEDVSDFLIDIMPIMFVPAGVGLMDSWGILKPIFIPFLIISLSSTVIVMGLTGKLTELMLRFKERREEARHE